MLAMAAGRTSSSTSGGAGGGSSSQWTSTRTRVSVNARGSPSAGAAVAVSTTTSTQYEHEELLSSGGSGITGTSLSADNVHGQDDDGDAHMPTTSSAYKSESEDEYDDDEDEWEDVGNDLPVFRDYKFPEPADDAEDSEYALSEDEDDDGGGQQQLSDEDLYASDLEIEEEESSVAGLFASVVRQLGAAAKKRRGKDNDSSNTADAEDPTAFTEQDKDFWATPEEKQQWAARFDAANKQFVHRYGCRIDSPAYPEAKAKLRREKKKKNVYALILFALCVAYLVQLIALSTNTVLTVQSMADSVKKCVNGLPHSIDVYQSVVGKLSSLLAPLGTSGSELRTPAAVVIDEAVVTISETRVLEKTLLSDAEDAVAERVVDVEGEAVAVHVVDEYAAEKIAEESETVGSVDEPETHSHDVGDINEGDADTALTEDIISAESPEEELDYAKVGVQLCSKLLNRLVKSKYDQTVKDAAIRACDAAVAISLRDSAHWVEAHVLRGDLWSLVSEFDAADEDYKGAAAAIVRTGWRQEDKNRLVLSQEIQAKILANQWISLFTKNKYKELRQEVGKVSRDDQQSAQLRALATDWLLVFKKKKQPFEVLTATRLWTLQRLEYA